MELGQEATAEIPSCWGFTFQALQKEQEKDQALQFIRQFLKDGTKPPENELFLASPESKYYWVNQELFQLKNGVLFRKQLESRDLELVVPSTLQEKVIQLHHDIPSKFFWVHL